MSDDQGLRDEIEAAFESRESLSPSSSSAAIREAVDEALERLDRGEARVAEKIDGRWIVHEWLKKAILLSFRLTANRVMSGGVDGARWWDKCPSKFDGWSAVDFERAGFRAVPSCVVRRSAHVASGAVLMPCFVNLGARVESEAMIDTWATVGSCAQVGRGVHVSGGAGIGGVLEPLQASPVIIEDGCFIGARAEIAEGVLVERGAVIAMGVHIGASTKIVDRATGEIFYGRVPSGSVVVPGSLPSGISPSDGSPSPSLGCAVIVKRVDERTRAKTSINELLRD